MRASNAIGTKVRWLPRGVGPLALALVLGLGGTAQALPKAQRWGLAWGNSCARSQCGCILGFGIGGADDCNECCDDKWFGCVVQGGGTTCTTALAFCETVCSTSCDQCPNGTLPSSEVEDLPSAPFEPEVPAPYSR